MQPLDQSTSIVALTGNLMCARTTQTPGLPITVDPNDNIPAIWEPLRWDKRILNNGFKVGR